MIGIRFAVPVFDRDLDPFEDGLLLPVPRQDGQGIELEERDGRRVRSAAVRDIYYSSGGQTTLRTLKVSATVQITDARVAVFCARYNKGGGWIGDPVGMLVLNAASKLRAAYMSWGKVLVAQVRYPWVIRVGSTPRRGMGSGESLIIDMEGLTDEIDRLQVNLPSDVNAAELAADIVRRVARHRLDCSPDLSAEHRPALERLLSAAPIAPDPVRSKDHIYFHQLPNYYPVSEGSARHLPLTASQRLHALDADGRRITRAQAAAAALLLDGTIGGGVLT